MAISVKRVYEAPCPRDGARVLVDRTWPHGFTKEDAAVRMWLRELAPSHELQAWLEANPEGWPRFRKRYLKEVGNAKGLAALEKLHRLAEGTREMTLLYGSRDDEHNNAVVLKELLDGTRKPPSSVGRGPVIRGRIRKAQKL